MLRLGDGVCEWSESLGGSMTWVLGQPEAVRAYENNTAIGDCLLLGRVCFDDEVGRRMIEVAIQVINLLGGDKDELGESIW
ncbi:hypothetical protein V6N13_109632 [Hibiscus sabdariffa]